MPHESMMCLVRGARRPECEELTTTVRRPAAAVPPVPPVNFTRRTTLAAPDPEDAGKWEVVSEETRPDGKVIVTERPRRNY